MAEHKATGNATDPVWVPPVLSSFNSMVESGAGEGASSAPVIHPGVVDKKAKTAAILLAGGSGERFRRQGGKQLVDIAGRPTLSWSLQALDACPDVGLIVLVGPEDRREEYFEKAVEPFGFVTPIVFAEAGTSRQESAFSGLSAVPDSYEFVVLHDGARPLISAEEILHTINTVKGDLLADGAIVAYRSIDTLKVVEDGMVVGTPDRSVLWNAQTPQVFRTGIYRRAHAAALADGFVGTDDSFLIERLGGRVVVVEGSRSNIKLTVPEDYRTVTNALLDLFNGKMQRVEDGAAAKPAASQPADAATDQPAADADSKAE